MTDALEDAWRVHAAIVDWTGKVDTKASFSVTLHTAAAAGVIVLAGPGRLFGELTGAALLMFRAAGVLLGIGLLAAMLVAIPRLRTSRLREEYQNNWIYFGHLRFWDGAELALAFAEQDQLPVICRQLVAMSRIAWVKHRRVQVSLTSGLLSGLCYFVVAVLR